MIEEIIGNIGKYSEEKVSISKGVLILIALGAFVFGLITGAGAAKLILGKKAVCCNSSGDDFDADEYVRNLNFDED